jgi:hypothetical protein
LFGGKYIPKSIAKRINEASIGAGAKAAHKSFI